ncbi:MAG: hypothetical protein AAFU85_08585 [Planctomycetota bacterium]
METSPHSNAEGAAELDGQLDAAGPLVEHETWESSSGPAETPPDGQESVFAAILNNTQLLEQILAHIAGERLQFEHGDFGDGDFVNGELEHGDAIAEASLDEIDAVDENRTLLQRNADLEQLVEQLRGEVDLLTGQNEELASKVARGNVVRSVSQTSVSSPTLTWEQRRQQILDEMENDSFDAESFLSTLQESSAIPVEPESDEPETGVDAVQYVVDLNSELERLNELIRQYEDSPNECASAADLDGSLADAIEADDVIQQEREKLRQLQTEWEERFRETEIEISLERAKLSRERREVESINEQLVSEVEELRRQLSHGDASKAGTRWMAKLGLISNT